MNKNKFLYILNQNLYSLSDLERGDIIADYEEHFRIGLTEHGLSEEEICERLGDPSILAAEFTSNSANSSGNSKNQYSSYDPNNFYTSPNYNNFNTSSMNNTNKSIITLLVILFNIFIGIWIIFSAFCVWFSLWVAAISLTAGGLFTAILSPFSTAPELIGLMICIGIALTSFGLLFSVGMTYLSKYMFIGLKKYFEICSNLCKYGTFTIEEPKVTEN